MRYLDGVLSKPPLSNVGLQERVRGMAEHLLYDFSLTSFEGMTFIDVGCGNGIASAAALYLGAKHVLSFDFQAASVQATSRLRSGVESMYPWDILQGSILDSAFVGSLPRGDLVYSFGMAMATGNSYLAMQNIAKLAAPDGLVLLLAHFKESGSASPDEHEWWRFKRKWPSLTPWQRQESMVAYMFLHLAEHMEQCLGWQGGAAEATFRGFNRSRACVAERFRHYARSNRGMDFMTDAIDWLGGFPYDWIPLPRALDFLHTMQPQMKVLEVLYSGLVGVLMTPRLTGSMHYMQDGMLVGHWEVYSWHELDPNGFLTWHDMQEPLQRLKSQAPTPAVKDVVAAVSQGEHGNCFFYPLYWENLTYPQSAMLRNLDLFAWGDDHQDGRLCHPEEGPRYLVLPNVLMLSTATGAHPRDEGHVYHLLRLGR